MSIQTTLLRDEGDTVVVGWPPVPGCKGYRFILTGSSKKPHTWDPQFQRFTEFPACNNRFAKANLPVTIEALGVNDSGVYPPSTPPPPPPPPSGFGADLWAGFEWAKAESSGPVVNVATVTELRAALSQSGATIDGGGRSFALGGQLNLPAVSQLTTLQNATLTGGRVNKSNTSKWRLRKLDVSQGTPEDNVKGSSGGFLHLDRCNIHHAPRQGFLMYPHDDVVISNCRIHHNGSTTNQDHGIYAGVGSRILVFNTVFYDNQAYQVQYYPHYHGGLFVCCTLYGGVTRGGIVFGSENTDPASDLRMVGCVAANSRTMGYEQYQTTGPILLQDCVGWNNAGGDLDSFSSTVTVTRFRHGDPKFVNPAVGDFTPGAGSVLIGAIDPSLYGLVPPLDINGKARVTADAGAFAA